jgi:hypothetical protein
MAKFVLEEGEQVIERARAENQQAGVKRGPGELVLTDRRVVLTDARNVSWAGAMFGALGGLFAGAFRDVRISCSIRRDEFASAEAAGKRELTIKSTGEVYVTRIDAKIKDAATWADRLQRWAVGETMDVASARVVKR